MGYLITDDHPLFRMEHHREASKLSAPTTLDGEAAGDICLGEVDEFVTTARQHGSCRIEREVRLAQT